MSDIPEYQRRQGIQPADGSGSFMSALGGVTQSYQAVSDIGAKLAQSSANEVYSQLGQEAGKTPGRNLHPAFTDADKHFVEAYKQQEYAIAATQGSDLLRKLSFDASNNPTPSALKDYEKNAYQGLEGILGGLTPGTEAALRSKFDESYSANYYKIAQEVENENQRVMKLNAKLFLDDRIKQSADLNAEGDFKGAKELDKDTVNWLKNGSGVVGITDGQIKEYSEILKKSNEAAQARYDMNRADIMGLGEKLLEDQLLQPRTEENNIRSEAMMEAYKQRKSFQAAQNSLLFDDASAKRDSGQLSPTDMIDYQSQMNAPTFAKFRRESEHYFRKQQAQQNDFDFINANAENAYRLAGVDAASRDKFLDSEVSKRAQIAQSLGIPYEDSMASRVALASQFKMNFPGLDKRIDAAIQGGSPEQAMMAMTEVEKASKQYKNPFLLQGVSKDSIGKATAFKRYMEGGNTTEDAYMKVNADITNLTPGEKEARKQRFKEETASKSSYDMSDFVGMTRVASDAMGFDPDLVPPSLAMRFRGQLEINNDYAETFQDALDMTAKEMRKTWGYTTINGYKEIMYMPPDMYVYGGEYAENLIHNQMIDSFKSVAADYKKLYDKNPYQDFYFELNSQELEPGDKASTANYRGGPIGITEGGTVRIKKIFRDGTVVKGTLNLESDDRTPTTGSAPNYIISFMTNNTSSLIKNPANNWMALRYIPDVEELKKEGESNPYLSAAENAREIRNKHIDKNKKVLDALKKQHNEVGYIAP